MVKTRPGSLVAEYIQSIVAHRLRGSLSTCSALILTSSVGATALLRAAYLVPSADVERFLAAVTQMRRRHSELSFVCTGPWPPYSFAALDREGAAA